MSHAKGVGIGGYADSSEDFLYSRYNHYAPLSFEREVKKLETLRYFPQHVGTYDGSLPINFIIQTEISWFTKLSSWRLLGDYTVTDKATKVAPPASDEWSLANNFPHTLFTSVACVLNDLKIVDSGSNSYPYKSYLENILSHPEWYEKKIMSADNFHRDTKQFSHTLMDVDANEPQLDTNDGYKKRKEGLINGGAKEFCVPIHNDLVTATRDLQPGYRLEFKFLRRGPGVDTFSIIQPKSNNKEYIIHLNNLRITVDKVLLVDKLFNHYYNNMKKGAQIPITRNKVAYSILIL